MYFIFLQIMVYTYGNDLNFPEIEGFVLEINKEIYYPENLYDLIDGAADMYLEHEFTDLHLCEYKTEDITISVEAYKHKDLKNTFGIYSTERSPDYNYINIKTEGYLQENSLNFFKNNYYIKINGYSESGKLPDETLKSIAEKISDAISDSEDYPDVIKILPMENKIAHSEGYANKSFQGYSFLNLVYFARYTGDTEFTIFIIENNDGIGKDIVSKYYNFAGITDETPKKGINEINDKYSGMVYLCLTNKYLIGFLNCTDKEIVKQYFNLFKED